MKAKERQELFNYMSNEHGLSLLENELDEIEHILGNKREYAKAKVKKQREIDAAIASYKGGLSKVETWSLSNDEIHDRIEELILNAPTPDFE